MRLGENRDRRDLPELMGSAQVEEIRREHCDVGRRVLPKGIDYPGSPRKVGERLPPRRAPIDPRSYSPTERACLMEALDQMLRNWPPGHPDRDAQWNILCALLERQGRWTEAHAFRDVLYLPVGVGKTFVALRWLLEQVGEEGARGGHYGIFLVPNEWIQQSVEHQVSVVATRAADYTRLRAVVADECHNWNPSPERTASGGSYTGALGTLFERRTLRCRRRGGGGGGLVSGPAVHSVTTLGFRASDPRR